MTTPSAEMPFLEHLEELRHRLIWSAGTLLVCLLVALTLVMRPSVDVIGILAAPVLPFLPDQKLLSPIRSIPSRSASRWRSGSGSRRRFR